MDLDQLADYPELAKMKVQIDEIKEQNKSRIKKIGQMKEKIIEVEKKLKQLEKDKENYSTLLHALKVRK